MVYLRKCCFHFSLLLQLNPSIPLSFSSPHTPTSLISPLATHEVAFVFMLGDGIQNITHRSPRPLNDNEWHYVEAEINVKMARLKVDFYPAAIRKFPGQTYISMQFTQPLLVGVLTE